MREFGANTLHRASRPPADRRVTRHSLWGYVATEGLLVCGMGHRLILRGVDPYSLAMARSFRRGSASDARSPHETVCGRAIGVRSFTYLWGVHCGFPKCGITTFECAMLEIVSSTGQGRNAKCSQGAGYEGKRIGGGGWTRTNDLRIMRPSL